MNHNAFQWRERAAAGYVSVGILRAMDYTLAKNGEQCDKSPRSLVDSFNKILSYPPNTPLIQIPEFRTSSGYPIIFGFNILRRKFPENFAHEKCRPVPTSFHVDTTVAQMVKRWNLQPILIG